MFEDRGAFFMLKLHQLDEQLYFPAAEAALSEPNGLLAFGGDLSVERLLLAYQNGIFPWFSEGEPILWWSPDPRGVMPLDAFHCSQSLKKLIRKQRFHVSINTQFEAVIERCANIPRADNGTWITEKMIDAYKQLHRSGHAHSLEVWDGKTLVGGLYGVAVGGVFCGESMFSDVSNASKVAYWYLVDLLKKSGAQFIDCQMQNPHLESLGCVEVTRGVFTKMLKSAVKKALPPSTWTPRLLSQ